MSPCLRPRRLRKYVTRLRQRSQSCFKAKTMGQAESALVRRSDSPQPSPVVRSRALKLLLANSDSLIHDTSQAREGAHGPFDITLVVKSTRFLVHRQILIDKSAYFRSMLSMFQEQFQDEVELKELVDPECLAKVLFFLYFKEIYLTPINAQDVLSLANYLQIESLQRRCSEYMQRRIDKQNCVSLYLYTLWLGPEDLKCHAEDYILSNFEKIVSKKSREFLLLPKDLLLSIIANERLLVSTESSVFQAVMSWVSFSPKDRTQHLPMLLEHVHFPLMSLNEVEQYGRDSRVKKTKNLGMAFEEAKQYFHKDPGEKIRYWVDKKKPARWPKIFVVMRMYWKNLPMEFFDFRTKQWNTLCNVQNWRSCAALVAFHSHIYLVGGEEMDPKSPTGSRTVNRVTRYDCELQKWSSAPSMNLARRWAASVVLGNTLYVIGGIGGRGGTYERRLDSVECLDLSQSKGKWKLVSSMSTARSSHTVEVLDGNIYVVGGGDGKEWLCTSEVYNPAKSKWSLIADLKTKRWKCGLCVLNGYLYAIGGMDSPQAGFWGSPLKSVERYFPATDQWHEVAPMNEARFGSAVVSYHGKIYVSGGFGVSKSILSSTEVYDPDTNRWTKINSMRKMCGFVGGVLVDRPIHFEEGDF